MVAAPIAEETQLVVEHVYKPRGNHRKLFRSRRTEILCSGPAGTGKTRAILEYLFWVATEYPGSRILIARKTRDSVTNSIQPILEDEVFPPNSGLSLHSRNQRYTLPNKSVMVIAGLDKDTKLFSAQYDIIYVNEATELTEANWESLNRALRAGKLPWKQLIGDCNPDIPTHWLMRRVEAGITEWIQTQHSDNPRADAEYLHRLETSLSGVRYQRLFLGKWVAAEGQVYDQWEIPQGTHLVDRFPNEADPFRPPDDWECYWVVDFGFTDPFVWQDWRKDKDSRLWLYREIYMTQRIVEDHGAQIKELAIGHPRPRALICDWDAENRAVLSRVLGMSTVPAFKDFEPGFEAVSRRLRIAGDGRPRLLVFANALVETDRKLWDKKSPISTAQEYPGHVWMKRPEGSQPTSRRRVKTDRPVDKDNHGMDATRYLVAHVDNIQSGMIPDFAPLGIAQQSKWTGNGTQIAAPRDGGDSSGSTIVLPKLSQGAARIGFTGWRPHFGQ